MSDKPVSGEPVNGKSVDGNPSSREPVTHAGRFRVICRAVPAVLVLAGIAAGLTVVAQGDWRVGSLVLAGSAMLGALLRALLPVAAVGALKVRSRLFDVAVFLAITALLAGMALVTVTPQR